MDGSNLVEKRNIKFESNKKLKKKKAWKYVVNKEIDPLLIMKK